RRLRSSFVGCVRAGAKADLLRRDIFCTCCVSAMTTLPQAGTEFRRWRLRRVRVWRDTRAMTPAHAPKVIPPREGFRDADAIAAVTSPWEGVLDRLNVSRVQAYDLVERGLYNGSSFLEEWLVSGYVSDV